MRDLGDVQQPGDPAHVHERAVRLHRLHHPCDHVPDAQAFARHHVRGEAVAHHQPVLFFVNLQELHRDQLPNQVLAVRHANRDVRLRHETAQVLNLHEQTPAVHAQHHAVHRLVVRLLVAAPVPSRFELCWVRK